jgi:hypothetical protein
LKKGLPLALRHGMKLFALTKPQLLKSVQVGLANVLKTPMGIASVDDSLMEPKSKWF